jgi:hypothetical protein
MKKFFVLIVIITAMWQIAQAQPVPQDTNVAWSVFTMPIHEIFNSPDGKFIYCNQNDIPRFIKIDAMTGQIIDSVGGKGLISGFSPDWKFIYTHYSTFESIKKLDINTYKAVDSIDNMQDIKDTNFILDKQFQHSGGLGDMKLTQDGRIIVSITYGKYILAILDANNLEIINKKLTSEVNDSLILASTLSVSPMNDYFVLQQDYQAYDKIKHQWFPWYKIYVWDLKTLKPIKEIFNQCCLFYDFKFSPDGKYFGLNYQGLLSIFNTENFSLYKQMNISHAIDFSNDSKNIAISIGSEIHFYNLIDFSEICTQTAYSTITLKFSSDNKFIYDFSAATGNLAKSKACVETDVKELNPIKDVVLTVNPITNELLIKNLIYGIYDYKITDVKGRVLIAENIEILNEQGKINIKVLPNGIYFLSLNKVSYKFMVSR